jgi:DNA-binding GntR family transcriptional regulator
MTQGELAEELGTVREVVVRALAALVDRGCISRAGRGLFVIDNRAALLHMSGIDSG